MSISPKKQVRLLDALRVGHYVTVACGLADVPRSSFYDMCREDPAFAADVAKAKADAEDRCLSAIMSEPTWQARAWVLERRYGKRWAKKAPDVVVQQVARDASMSLPEEPSERAAVLRALADRLEGKV